VRIAAFAAICLSGLAGAMIGYSLVSLQCEGDCGVWEGIGLLVGALAPQAAWPWSLCSSCAHGRVARDRGPRQCGPRAHRTQPLMNPDPAVLRSLAEDLGGAAPASERSRDVVRSASANRSSTTRSPARPDPVTEFDRAAEQLIVDALRSSRPHDAIVGEEGADDAGTSGLEWHIDPIDGTANFVYDLPSWCTSVAVVDAHGPLAGAVLRPGCR